MREDQHAPGQWFAYTMENADGDGRYDNGAVFQYQATPDQLPTNSARSGGGVGEYNYYFETNDGTRTAIFPNRPDAYQGINDPGDIGHDQAKRAVTISEIRTNFDSDCRSAGFFRRFGAGRLQVQGC